jgi:hypothetical protein
MIGALAAAAVVLMFFAIGYAQGSATAPTATLYTPISPGQSQNLVFEVNLGVYSAVAPNNIWQAGTHLYVTAIERTSLGNTYILLNQQPEAPNVGSSSGGFYQLSNALSLTTVAACSGIQCAGVTENITLSMNATVVTPLKAWTSPSTTAIFSSLTASQCSVGVPCPPVVAYSAPNPAQPTSAALDTFLLELLAPLTLLVAVEAFGVYAIVKHPGLAWTGGIAVVILVVEFVIL